MERKSIDYNVSSIKNKFAESKVNSCMKSIKTIINDYKPIKPKEKKYDILEYEGKVSTDTVFTVKGIKPTEEIDVMGTTGMYNVLCGKLGTDGIFRGKDVKYRSYKKEIYERETIYSKIRISSTKEPQPGTTLVDVINIPGSRPNLLADKSYTTDEILYQGTEEAPLDKEEVIIKIQTNSGSITIKVKDFDEGSLGGKITLNTLYSLIRFKAEQQGLDIGSEAIKDSKDETKFFINLFVKEQSSSRYIIIGKTTFTEKLYTFGEGITELKDEGLTPETIKYKFDKTEPIEKDGVITVVTNITQPRQTISNIELIDSDYYYDVVYAYTEKTLIETWTENVADTVYIHQLYC